MKVKVRRVPARQIYWTARHLGYLPALNLARCAGSAEERYFFTYVADMNLRRRQQVYIRNERYDHSIPPLAPSSGGKECLGNGTWPGYECQCDECDHCLECFPESI